MLLSDDKLRFIYITLYYQFWKSPGNAIAFYVVYTQRRWRHCDRVIVPQQTRSGVFVLFCCWALTLDRPVLAAPTVRRILVVDRRLTPYCCAPLLSCSFGCRLVFFFLTIRVLLLCYLPCVSHYVLKMCVPNVQSPSKPTRIMACDRWRVIASILVSISYSLIRCIQNGRSADSFRYFRLAVAPLWRL